MFKPVRIVATIVFLASIGLVFVGAFVIRNAVRFDRSLLAGVLLIYFFHDSGAMYQ